MDNNPVFDFKSILDNTNTIIIVISKKLELLFYNKFAEKYFNLNEKHKSQSDILQKLFCDRCYDSIISILNKNKRENVVICKNFSNKSKGRYVSWNIVKLEKEKFVLTGTDITELKETEEELGQKENEYQTIVNDQTEFICRWLPDGTITFINPALCRYLDARKEQIIGKKIYKYIFSIDKQKVVDRINEITFENPIVETEDRVTKNKKDYIWVQWVNRGIFDKNKKLIEYQSVGRDVTYIKQYQVEIRAKEKHYQSIVEDQTDLICRFNVDGVLTFVNKAFCDYFGYPKEELVGESIFEHLPKEDLVDVKGKIKSINIKNPVIKYEHKVNFEDGSFRWQHWTDRGIFNEKGELIEYQSTGTDITERKEAEDTLIESEARFRILAENMPILVNAYDQDGNFTFWNKECERVTGYTSEEIIGNPVGIRLLYPDDEYYDSLMKQWGENPIFRGWDMTLTSKDGTEKIVSWYNISDQFPVPRWRTWAIGVDITDRKKAEDKLLRRIRYEEALEKCSKTLLSDQPVKDVMNEVLEYLLCASQVSRVYIFENFIDEEDKLRTSQNYEVCLNGVPQQKDNPELVNIDVSEGFSRWKSILEKGDTVEGFVEDFPQYEQEFLGAQNIVSILVIPIILSKSRWHGFIGFDDVEKKKKWDIEDIRMLKTASEMISSYLERKEAEQALMESEEKHRALVENAVDGIVLVKHGRFIFANKALLDFIGYREDEFYYKSINDILPHEENRKNKIIEAYKERVKGKITPLHYEAKVLTKDGKLKDINVASTIITIKGEKVTLAVIKDITEKKEAEKEREDLIGKLEIANKELVELNKIKDDFLAITSHDLRVPFLSTMGMTDMLLNKHDLDRQTKRFIELIHDSTKNQLKYINDLLDIVMSETGKLKLNLSKVRINKIIENSISNLKILSEKKNITLEAKIKTKKEINVDEAKIIQVLNNLISNAIKFTHNQGNIIIRCEENENNEIEIHVIDNGVGIPEDRLSQLFTRFKSVSTEGTEGELGTGLGLPICKSLIEIHGGLLKVESKIGEGSDFNFTLP